MYSVDNLYKYFGHRSGATEGGSEPSDTRIVFMKVYFENVNFEKVGRRQQKLEKLHRTLNGLKMVRGLDKKIRGGSRISGKGVQMYKGRGFAILIFSHFS